MLKSDSVLTKLGQNVRQARETKQFSQEKLAEIAGLENSDLRRLPDPK